MQPLIESIFFFMVAIVAYFLGDIFTGNAKSGEDELTPPKNRSIYREVDPTKDIIVYKLRRYKSNNGNRA